MTQSGEKNMKLKCERCTKNEVAKPGACDTCRAQLDTAWKRMVKWAKKRGYYRRERKLKVNTNAA